MPHVKAKCTYIKVLYMLCTALYVHTYMIKMHTYTNTYTHTYIQNALWLSYVRSIYNFIIEEKLFIQRDYR